MASHLKPVDQSGNLYFFRKTELESEEIVSELVHSFLLPEVQKETFRARVRNGQRKYLLAAHKEIAKDGEAVIKEHPGKFSNQQS